MVDVPLAGGGGGGGGALAFPVEQRWTEGQVAVAGGGGEEGLAFAQGAEQQVALAGFVPEHAFAVDPGGFGAEHAKGRFDFGAAVVAVHAQRHRQRPGQRVEAALGLLEGPLSEQLQQLDQLLALGAGLPEHRLAQNYLKAGPEIRAHLPGPVSADQRVCLP